MKQDQIVSIRYDLDHEADEMHCHLKLKDGSTVQGTVSSEEALKAIPEGETLLHTLMAICRKRAEDQIKEKMND